MLVINECRIIFSASQPSIHRPKSSLQNVLCVNLSNLWTKNTIINKGAYIIENET